LVENPAGDGVDDYGALGLNRGGIDRRQRRANDVGANDDRLGRNGRLDGGSLTGAAGG
jgi:hypothetical protein